MLNFLLNGYEKLAENVNANLTKGNSGDIEIYFAFNENLTPYLLYWNDNSYNWVRFQSCVKNGNTGICKPYNLTYKLWNLQNYNEIEINECDVEKIDFCLECSNEYICSKCENGPPLADGSCRCIDPYKIKVGSSCVFLTELSSMWAKMGSNLTNMTTWKEIEEVIYLVVAL